VTVTIPIWLLWVLGIVIGLPIVLFSLFLMYLGWQFLRAYSTHGSRWPL
jgi:hypothetical protein